MEALPILTAIKNYTLVAFKSRIRCYLNHTPFDFIRAYIRYLVSVFEFHTYLVYPASAGG